MPKLCGVWLFTRSQFTWYYEHWRAVTGSTPSSQGGAVPDSIAPENDLLLGRLKQLQTRYPTLIRDAFGNDLVMTVEFYLADVAIDATYSLLREGITAVHQMNCPQRLMLQLPSLIGQDQIPLAIQTLDAFLRQCTAAGMDRPGVRPGKDV